MLISDGVVVLKFAPTDMRRKSSLRVICSNRKGAERTINYKGTISGCQREGQSKIHFYFESEVDNCNFVKTP